MLETLEVERVPPRPEESFFPEFAYSSKNRPRSFHSNKEKWGREMDATVNRLIHSVSEISRKLDDLKSHSEKTDGGNERGKNQTGSNRINRQFNKKNHSAVPSRGIEASRQRGHAPVIERTPKPEPPFFNRETCKGEQAQGQCSSFCYAADPKFNYD